MKSSMMLILCTILLSSCQVYQVSDSELGGYGCGNDFLNKIEIAKQNANTSVCDEFSQRGHCNEKGYCACELSNNEEFRPDDCLLVIAEGSQNISVCIESQSIEFKYSCYNKTKDLLKNPQWCEIINTDYGDSEECMKYVAKTTNNIALCKKINHSFMYKGELIEENKICMAEVAKYNNNLTMCEEEVPTNYKKYCYLGIAWENADISTCYKINDNTFVSMCIGEVANKRDDILLCNQIQDDA